jgi:cell division protein FtsI (penicillin-binding protein 3)/stage V sporulation protein D (sporulation-specific penicillin-binding protein)
VTRRFGSPWFLIFVFFGIVIWRLTFLQLFPDPRVENQSRRQYWIHVPVSTNRGFIYDRNGNALAVSVPSSSFFLDPAFWNPSDAVHLKGILPDSLVNTLSKPLTGRFLWLARKVDTETAEKIRSLKIKGIFEIEEKKRLYPSGSLLSHVLGFCDIDDKGLSGIELMWDKALFSPPGLRVLAKESSGRTLDISRNDHNHTPTEGGNVSLTIDSRIQFIVERRLEEGILEHNARWGSVICMDPHTGAILSMASWPTFNPNVRADLSKTQNLLNNSIGRTYEPGSTFKPVILGISMERGSVHPNESFNCPYRIKIADGHISEAGKSGFGKLTVPEILAKSSNTGMAQIGIRVKPFNMYHSVREWGFGKPTGIELPGAEEGLLASPEQWRGVVPSNIAIGQGLAITPLHLASAISAIANGGTLMRPHIVSKVVDSSGNIVYNEEGHFLRTVLSPQIALWLQRAMVDTVIKGTGRNAAIPGISIAAKTGTAQIAEKGEYAKGRWVSSFAGFWPSGDARYVVLVVIGEPSKGKYYGGDVAAPVFRRIVEDMEQIGLLAALKTEG